jgi:transposase
VYGELFGTTFDLLLYDVTSTYFEGLCEVNPQARRGYSRDKRPDCLQVCIALVATPEGLPLAYEVFNGNRTDVTTVAEIVEMMREKFGHERRVWVMDRGMVSEENLEMLREVGASWLVGTPKTMLKEFERELLDKRDWSKIEPGIEVKLCAAPDGSRETFVLCHSPLRAEKEKAMRSRQVEKLTQAFEKMRASTQAPKRALRDRDQALVRAGRHMGKFPSAARLFEIEISEYPDPEQKGRKRLAINVRRKAELDEWAARADGAYLLRTNLTGHGAEELWRTYMGLTQIEDSFRIAKHDLGLRPIFHQKEERAQAHIFVCFLSLVLWRTLQQWMEASGLGSAPRKFLEEMAEVRSLDVVLPTGAGQNVRLRTVSRPEPRLAILLQRLDLLLPNRPKKIQNVVEKNTQKMQISEELRRFCL